MNIRVVLCFMSSALLSFSALAQPDIAVMRFDIDRGNEQKSSTMLSRLGESATISETDKPERGNGYEIAVMAMPTPESHDALVLEIEFKDILEGRKFTRFRSRVVVLTDKKLLIGEINDPVTGQLTSLSVTATKQLSGDPVAEASSHR